MIAVKCWKFSELHEWYIKKVFVSFVKGPNNLVQHGSDSSSKRLILKKKKIIKTKNSQRRRMVVGMKDFAVI